ncbi:DUF1937 family protein [Dryocola sp. BD586]|jgi:hypothetical protein|uniref:DUF1937 family protein n=1 Tax=Dryocola sp. BD586 TaxID=3133271 RepID=UPI003F501724
MRKIFLACPYSHADDAVVAGRVSACNQVAATLIEAGHAVYSQVTLSHPLNGLFRHTQKSDIGKRWAPVDALFLDAMEELIVVDLPGWDKSAGIQREMEFYRLRGQPVSLWSEVEHLFAPVSIA